MIFLSTLKDEKKVAEIYKDASVEKDENSYCLTAEENGKILGFCLFGLDGEKITVRLISPEKDIVLADGILRSTLHVAAERSVMNAFYEDTVSEELLKKLGFIKSKEEKTLNIDKLFKNCCDCK